VSKRRKLLSTCSSLHSIRVVEENGKRVLYFGDQSETEIDPANPGRGGLEYTTAVPFARLFHSELRRVLVIGLGGGSLVTGFLDDYPDVLVDVVEVDPVVVDVARRYFGLPKSRRLRVLVDDGRAFLRRTRRRYDLIVMDAYTTD